MTITDEELAIRFTYHAPRLDQVTRFKRIRDEAHKLAKVIMATTPESREQSLAITALEDVVYNANAAIARREL